MGGIYFKKVTSKAELDEVFRLRYRVYCEERGFERPQDHPDGLEVDRFDRHAVHFAAYNEKRATVGTARIILDSEEGFPLERNCVIDRDVSLIERKRLGEISRLAVSKDYRRRLEDRFIYDGLGDPLPEAHEINNDRRHRHEIVLGLYKSIYIESKRLGLTHWYTVMAKGLFLLMGKMGVVFSPIGPTVDYHGWRTPYLGSIEEIEREVARLNPSLFREARDELGRLTGS